MRLIVLIAFFLSGISLQGQIFDYYAPEPFGEILDNPFSKSWSPKPIPSVENRAYVIILDESGSSAVTLNSGDRFKLDVSPVAQVSSSTYGSMLRSIFQLDDLNSHKDKRVVPLTGQYKINPFLHSYFSIGTDEEGNVVCSDAGTMQIAESAQQGFLLVEFTGQTSSAKIKATGQWIYDPSADTVVDNSENWATQWLQMNDGVLKWISAESEASTFMLADATDLIALEIEEGSDFNPLRVEYQLNETAPFSGLLEDIKDSRLLEQLPREVSDESVAQFGTSDDAATAASATLDEIKTTLEAKGASMRYPKEFYLAIRAGMLSQRSTSTDVYGGRLDYNTISDVYFTNASNDEGEPHPFMVVVSFAVSARPNQLLDIHRPPGAGGGPGYGESSVTRRGKVGDFLIKIPIRDYGLIGHLEDNNLSPYGDLATDFDEDHQTTTTRTVYNYAATAACGVAIDGVTIYPAMNNNIRFAVEDAEIAHSGIHVGGGLELHYHADGHSFNENGINLYNLSDYEGHDHPPIVGIGYDGVALFGKYEVEYPQMTGYGVSLDEYGGHIHGDGFGYHYHAHTEEHQSESSSQSFTEHFLMVGAWRGNINDIPGFYQSKLDQIDNESIARYVGAEYTPGTGPTLGTFDPQVELIYPNPSDGILTLKTEVPYRLFLYDYNGKVVWSGETNGSETTFSILHIGSGSYLMKGVNSRNTFFTRIVIR